MMHNRDTFKNAFQYQMAKFNNAKLQLLLHQPNKTPGIIHYNNKLKKKHIITSVLSSSVISNSATPWLAALQALCPWYFLSKNTGVGCHFLLQGTFLIQGMNPRLVSLALTGRIFPTSISWEATPPGAALLIYRFNTIPIKTPVSPYNTENTANIVYNHGSGGLVAKSHLTLETPWTTACQAPVSMGFSRQEYWSGLPFPSPITTINGV